MIGFINVNDFCPNYSEFRAVKKKSVFTLFCFPLCSNRLRKSKDGREIKKRKDWERGRDMGSRAFHVCISLYIASCLCLVFTSDSLFVFREK